MSRPIRKHFAPLLKASAPIAVLALLVPAAAQAGAGGEPTDRWTRTLTLDLSARDLGLPAPAPAQRLGRAALERKAGRLGLRGSTESLRLDRRLRTPALDGARALTQLRFQQTAGSLRVVWSQIDVTIVAGEVSSIVATVVPTKGGAAAGERRVSGKEALGIALGAVPGAERALRPLPAAYAGTPSADRRARARRARRAWVVEVEAGSGGEEDASSGLCIVVDAETGKVIGRWPGMADRPDRGPNARGAESSLLSAEGATLRDARDKPSVVLQVWDGDFGAKPEPLTEAPRYAFFGTSGDPRVNATWPSYQEARDSGVTPTAALEGISANAANVARTICNVRGYCGRSGGFQPGASSVFPWNVIGNTFNGLSSSASRASFHVWIRGTDIMRGTGDPNVPANDVVAHEFGHVMDWVYAGDRFAGAGGVSFESLEVEEALADMFAYEYDRGDATLGEESADGISRNWADPETEGNPAHMDDYADNPPSQHFNSTILSHAYYLFVQRIGHHRAGRVLHNVPSYLSPRPTFQEVVNGFVYLSRQIYPQDGSDSNTSSDVADAAIAGFAQVGLQSHDHRGE